MKLLAQTLAAALLCAAVVRTSSAADQDWRLSSSLNYASGDYGTNARTNSLYVPVTLKGYWGDAYGSLTVPFLSQTSNGQVSNVGGNPVKTGRGRGSSNTTTHSGMGDIVVHAGYALMTENQPSSETSQPFDLTVDAKVKAPTADEDKGLGTGEFDAGIGLELGKLVAPGWTALADLYLTKIGDPPGTDFNDQISAAVGVSHLLAERLTATAMLEGGNALVDGEDGPRALRGILDYKVDDRLAVFVGGLVGLSDGSPDFGMSFGGSVRF